MKKMLCILLAVLILGGCGGGGGSTTGLAPATNFAGTWVKDTSMFRTEITLSTVDNVNYTGKITCYGYNPDLTIYTFDHQPMMVGADLIGSADPTNGLVLRPVLNSTSSIDNLRTNIGAIHSGSQSFILNVYSERLDAVSNPNLPAPHLNYNHLSYNLRFDAYNKSVWNTVYHSEDWTTFSWFDEMYR